MTTGTEKFRKLLAAYEDEVQRKQHKMGKRVEPTDEPSLNVNSGYCTFLRAGQQVIWSPSFDIIGSFDDATFLWTWSWADETDTRNTGRIDSVRRQGQSWGIEQLTTPVLQLHSEQEAWELSIVATAVTNADAMYRLREGKRSRFLALFDGPPPSRSQMLRANRTDSQTGLRTAPSTPAIAAAGMAASPPSIRATPYPGTPALGRTPTGNPPISTVPASDARRTSSSRFPAVNPALGRTPSGQVIRPAIAPKLAPSMTSTSSVGPEPTDWTKAELGTRIFELMTTSQQGELGSAHLLARAIPPVGPVGTVSFETKLVLRPSNGPEVPLSASTALLESLAAVFARARERNGAAFQYLTARLEASPQGLVTHVFLES